MSGANIKGFRQNASNQINGGNRAIDLSYVDRAGALKTIGCVLGELTPLGDTSTAINCQLGQSIAFYNDSGSTVYAAFALTTAALAALGSLTGANAIAIPPRQYVVLTSGNNNYFKTSAGASTCWAYDINDPTRLG